VEQMVSMPGTDPVIAPGATGHHQCSSKVDQRGFGGARNTVSLTALDTGWKSSEFGGNGSSSGGVKQIFGIGRTGLGA